MGTMKNGIIWNGAYINGNRLSGAMVNGKQFYEYPHFLLEYTDKLDVQYVEKFSNENDLKEFISSKKGSLKTVRLSTVGNIKIYDCSQLFPQCADLIEIDMRDLDTSEVKNFSKMCVGCTRLVTLKMGSMLNAEDIQYMCQDCYNLLNVIFTEEKINNVKNSVAAFERCYDLLEIDLTMFSGNSLLKTTYMFGYDNKLKTIYCNDDWNNGNLSASAFMFEDCVELVGATSFNSLKTDIKMANPDTGYFTRK